MSDSSTVKLVAALTDAGAPSDMIARAKANHYHDFKSPLDTPCIQLVKDLSNAVLADLGNAKLEQVRRAAMDGAFDATKAESDEWAASPEGRAAIISLGFIGLTFPPTR